MKNITIARSTVNPEALDEALRAAFGERVYGVSAGGGRVIVHLDDGVSLQEMAQAEQIVTAHDATLLSTHQQAVKEREQRLEVLRAEAPLDVAVYAGDTAEVAALAQKIAWLEEEVRDLRGL